MLQKCTASVDAAISHAAVAQETLACHSTKTTSLVFHCVPMASCTCHGSVLLQESIHGSRQRAELVQPKTPLKHLMTAHEAFGSAAHKELLIFMPLLDLLLYLCLPLQSFLTDQHTRLGEDKGRDALKPPGTSCSTCAPYSNPGTHSTATNPTTPSNVSSSFTPEHTFMVSQMEEGEQQVPGD